MWGCFFHCKCKPGQAATLCGFAALFLSSSSLRVSLPWDAAVLGLCQPAMSRCPSLSVCQHWYPTQPLNRLDDFRLPAKLTRYALFQKERKRHLICGVHLYLCILHPHNSWNFLNFEKIKSIKTWSNNFTEKEIPKALNLTIKLWLTMCSARIEAERTAIFIPVP